MIDARAVLGVLLLAGSADAQDLWADLEPGPYGVGFRSEWTFDPARTYDTTFSDGERYSEAGRATRPILVNVWYPATADGEPGRMPHGGYLEILSDDPRIARLAVELADYERGVIAEYTLGKPLEQLDESEVGVLERLLATPTACTRDAPPAAGAFPLVLYHSGYGSSFEDNSVLCEYLASHGFVVVGSAFQSEQGGSLNIDGKDGSVRDLAFLIRHMQASPGVDLEHIGVVGHSGGAHAILSFQAQPSSAVDAVVSLDTTQDYVSALDPHWHHPRTMLADVSSQTAPLLIVANPHAFFQVCDALVHADRTYLTFRDLEHNDYTLQGVLLAENTSTNAEAVRRGFQQCCEYVWLFLDANLNASEQARRELETLYVGTTLGGDDPHVERVPVGSAQPDPFDVESQSPPTPRQLRRLFDDPGAKQALEILVRFHASHPAAPIFESQLNLHLLHDLVARGRADEAAVLAPFFAELNPDMVGTLLWWVGRSGGDGYREYRIQALTTVLLLEPDNATALQQLEEEQG